MKQDKPTIGVHVHSTWPGITEVIGNTGKIDYVEFTSTYAPFDLYDLENIARTTELYDMSSMMKVDVEPKTFLAQRALGAGIQNILFTDIRTVEDAKESVRAVRCETPEAKGINGCHMQRNVGYLLEYGTPQYCKAMDDAVVAIMIEKAPAVENLDEILSVEGVDMVQFGPCDYSMSIGIPGQRSDPRVKEARLKMIKAALDRGIHPREEIDLTDLDAFTRQAEEYINLGVRDFCIGVDIVMIHNWCKKFGGELRELLSAMRKI